MSQKNIEFKSRKVKSHDEKEIRFSQHKRNKKDIIKNLEAEIPEIKKKKDEAGI
jgi:hypothetical protein